MKRTYLIDAAACVLLSVVVWLLYGKILRLWWMYDDANHIHDAVLHRWFEYFTNDRLWLSMPNRLFTPILSASYDGELSLFGLNARAWYLTQLAWLVVDALSLFALLRLWMSTAMSATGALMFISGVPVAAMAAQLMVMHYWQSIALIALSTLTFVLAMRRSQWMAYVSAVLYLFAMLAKEIAVPLPLLLVFIPEGDARKRIRALVPHVVALGMYAVWRTAMLHTPFGGYGWAVPNVFGLIASLPLKIALALGASAVVMLIGVIAAMRTRRGAVLVAIGLLIAIAPIAPMSAHMQERLALGAWLCLTIAFTFGVTAFRPAIGACLIVSALAVVIITNRQGWSLEFDSAFRMSSEARAFFALRSNDLLRAPLVPPAAMSEMRWLKEDRQGKQRGAGWFYDDIFLCEGHGAGRRIWQYEDSVQRVVEITSRVQSIARRYCGAVRNTAPLIAEFHHRNGTLAWRFGPYSDGSWRVLIGDAQQAFDVPREDAFRLGDLNGIALRIRYQSPQQWVTYSPEITLDFQHHPDALWHR